MKIILSTFFTFYSIIIFAQKYEVTGKVTDVETQEELIGVNIFSEGDRMRGTVTDYEGNYKIEIEAGSKIVFKYVGYMDTSFVINSSQILNVKMGSSAMNLNTVVISANRRKEKILDVPASITVIDATAIQNKVSINVNDIIKDQQGVFVAKSGIQGGTPSVRGLNGYSNGNLMTLVDNRINQVPSFRLNSFNFLTTTNDDLGRIELLKGPAASLYGPNTSNGVLHMITKSPIDNQETSFSLGIGFRSKIKDTIQMIDKDNPRFDNDKLFDRGISSFNFRHADTIGIKNENIKMGYKLSTQALYANDWKYNDPNDPEYVVRYIPTQDGVIYLNRDGNIDPKGVGQKVRNERDETIKKFSVDSRVDLRYKDETQIIFAGGFNVSSDISMFPVGATQNVGWKSYYAQMRILWKDFFFQTYGNFNNTGDTYFVPTGGLYIDKSRFYSTQVQHTASPHRSLKLTYGLDAFWTNPRTEGTLNGRYENEDNIQEYGGYLQADYKPTNKLTFLGAFRIDYFSPLPKPTYSPKAAVIFKPGTGQNMRLTFDRAFRTPGAGSHFIDVRQAELPTQIGVRALGTSNSGFQYNYANNPYFDNRLLAQFRSPFASNQYDYYNVGDQSINNAAWNGIVDAIKDQFLVQFDIQPNPLITDIIDQLIGSLLPSDISSENIGHVVKDLNSTTRTFLPSDWENLQDIKGLKNVTTNHLEVGYKGIIKNFVSVSVDAYRTSYKNYIAPVIFVTPAVLFDATALMNYVSPILSNNLNDPNNAAINQILVQLLDNNSNLGGNSNGQASDELSDLITTAVENLPFGIITPEQATGAEMLLVSYNIGDFDLYGFETGFTAYLTKQIRVSGQYSFVDKDSIRVPGAQFGYVALNSPRHKFNVGGNYFIEKLGLNIGARFNWQAGFPVNTGNFAGRVKSYHDIDLDVAWTPPFKENVKLALSVQNIYNNEQQFFIGSPFIGSMYMLRLGYNI